jgi:hypothetical protein
MWWVATVSIGEAHINRRHFSGPHKEDTLPISSQTMPRDTIVSWKTFALFILFPPVAIIAIVLFPLTLAVLFWLYYRGRNQARLEDEPTELRDSPSDN